MARLMIGMSRMALRGVVTIVLITPRCAKSLAMSVMGIRCPGDISGIITK